MRRLALLLLAVAPPAPALSPAAQAFIEVSKMLEPVHCEKRKLRREIALAQAESRVSDAERLRARFEALNRDPKTARLERRLAELEPKILDARGKARFSEDLEALSLQQRRAFYDCE